MPESTSSGTAAVEKQVESVAPVEHDQPQVYHGSGTPDDPFVVEWLPNDPENPM